MDHNLNIIMRLIDKVSGPLRAMQASMSTMDVQLKAMQSAWKNNGATMRQMGRTTSLYLTAPLALLGTYATKTAISFEDAFAGVRKTVEATEQEFSLMRKQFINMSTRIPMTTEELMKIGELAGQLGIENKNIVKFSETMANLAATTNLSSENAAIALARFQNITQMSEGDFDRLGSVIVALGNNLATTEAEIVDMAMGFASAGKQVRMSEADIMAFAAALSSVGLPAEMASTAVARLFYAMKKEIGTGSKELEKFAEVASASGTKLSGNQWGDLFKRDSATAIQMFFEGLGKMEKSGKNVQQVLADLHLSDVRLLRAVTSLAVAEGELANARRIARLGWEQNIALTEEAAKRYETAKSKLTMFKSELRIVAAAFGDIIIPGLIAVLRALKPIIFILQHLPAPIRAVVSMMLALVALAGPIMWLAGSVKGLMAAWGPMVALVKTLAVTLGVSLGTFLWWVVAIVAAVWALYAAWQAIKSTRIGDFFRGVAHSIQGTIDGIVGFFTVISRGIRENLNSKEMQTTGSVVGNLFRSISASASKIGINFGSIWRHIKQFANADPILRPIINLFRELANVLQKIAGVWGKISGWWRRMRGVGAGVRENLKGSFAGVEESVGKVRTPEEQAAAKEKEQKEADELMKKKYPDLAAAKEAERESAKQGEKPYWQKPAGESYNNRNQNSQHDVKIVLGEGLKLGDIKERKRGNSNLNVVNTPGYAGSLAGGS